MSPTAAEGGVRRIGKRIDVYTYILYTCIRIQVYAGARNTDCDTSFVQSGESVGVGPRTGAEGLRPRIVLSWPVPVLRFSSWRQIGVPPVGEPDWRGFNSDVRPLCLTVSLMSATCTLDCSRKGRPDWSVFLQTGSFDADDIAG